MIELLCDFMELKILIVGKHFGSTLMVSGAIKITQVQPQPQTWIKVQVPVATKNPKWENKNQLKLFGHQLNDWDFWNPKMERERERVKKYFLFVWLYSFFCYFFFP